MENPLFTKSFGEISITHYNQIDSTNTHALALISGSKNLNALNKTVISSNAQNHGRGRMGRFFYSPQNTGIYFSIIYTPQSPITNPALLTVTAAIAVCRTLEKEFHIEPKIKWVNDIFLNDKKICGILTEGHCNDSCNSIDAAVTGIGINLSTCDFPENLSQAGSITACLNQNSIPVGELDYRISLIHNITQQFFNLLETADGWNKTLSEYRQKSFLTGRKVCITPVIGQSQNNYKATVIGIDEQANLIVQTADGQTRHLSSGEITLHCD